jgi:hypothetical protein
MGNDGPRWEKKSTNSVAPKTLGETSDKSQKYLFTLKSLQNPNFVKYYIIYIYICNICYYYIYGHVIPSKIMDIMWTTNKYIALTGLMIFIPINNTFVISI